MSSEIAGPLEHSADRPRSERKHARVLAVEALGPLTVVVGVVWAIAQPYRIAFLYPEGKGLYDFIAQPPLLVVLAGLAFGLFVAPGLVADLEAPGVDDDRTAA
jgi:hypothetical protein